MSCSCLKSFFVISKYDFVAEIPKYKRLYKLIHIPLELREQPTIYLVILIVRRSSLEEPLMSVQKERCFQKISGKRCYKAAVRLFM